MSPAFGLYVHWPFCRSKCPYCDFNSHVREGVDHHRWKEALLGELAHFAAMVPGRLLGSLYFGGGTPSLMEVETVAAVIAAARTHWTVSPDFEITLEANPTSVEAEKFAGFRDAGINRLSLGVQSLDDEALKFLGRRHDALEAIRALDLARATFPRVSFDLIYARPGQSLADWSRELVAALSHAADHISLYQLTIEPATQFEQAYARGDFVLPAEEDAARLYEATLEALSQSGLVDYEISNFAKPGSESRHNLVYWRYGDYIGIGPGAHGRLTLAEGRIATRQHRAPEAWLAMVEDRGHATRASTPVTPRRSFADDGRAGQGVPSTASPESPTGAFGMDRDTRLEPLIEGGFLGLGGARVAPHPRAGCTGCPAAPAAELSSIDRPSPQASATSGEDSPLPRGGRGLGPRG
jgi:oxygen-independent coproporphyrinogen-3 oxidase